MLLARIEIVRATDQKVVNIGSLVVVNEGGTMEFGDYDLTLTTETGDVRRGSLLKFPRSTEGGGLKLVRAALELFGY